eukprot:1415180-Ditylum_brightwellii.AAC.1
MAMLIATGWDGPMNWKAASFVPKKQRRSVHQESALKGALGKEKDNGDDVFRENCLSEIMEEMRVLSIFKRREISCDHAHSYNHYVWLQIAFLSKTVQRGRETTV